MKPRSSPWQTAGKPRGFSLSYEFRQPVGRADQIRQTTRIESSLMRLARLRTTEEDHREH